MFTEIQATTGTSLQTGNTSKVQALHGLDQGPRDQIAAMLSAADVLETRPGHKTARQILADHGEELSALLHPARRPDWPWFEIIYGEDACRLPEALIRAGAALDNSQFVSRGLQTLEWMLSGEAGRTCAEALQDACEAAFAVTGEPHWLTVNRTAARPRPALLLGN